MSNIVSSSEHYDLLIDENNDPFRDGEILKTYMKRWDGDKFYESLELSQEKLVLEVGVGTGRVADNVLQMGCKRLTGIDNSVKTVSRAKENLESKYSNVEILLEDIINFSRTSYYDVAYSILTFMHIENKERALENIVKSLKPQGIIVLSISKQPEWLECGRRIKLYLKEPQFYIDCLGKLGCGDFTTIDLIDDFVLPNGKKQPEYGQVIATIVKCKKTIL